MKSQSTKPIVVLVIGGPASGKGTHCKKLAEEFNFIHLSIGDILREERLKDTDEGRFLDIHMKEFEQTGKLMPINVVSQFLVSSMMSLGWEKNKYLIDGFIKTKSCYYAWIDTFSKLVVTKFVLYLECSPEEMLRRLTIRSETSGRLDDDSKLFKIRIDTFYQRTYPAVEMFADLGLVKKVNTEGSLDKVYSEIEKICFKYFENSSI
jgi:adenylate kinase family enzyme